MIMSISLSQLLSHFSSKDSCDGEEIHAIPFVTELGTMSWQNAISFIFIDCTVRKVRDLQTYADAYFKDSIFDASVLDSAVCKEVSSMYMVNVIVLRESDTPLIIGKNTHWPTVVLGQHKEEYYPVANDRKPAWFPFTHACERFVPELKQHSLS